MKIARLTISDRASMGVYEDRSGPELEQALQEMLGDECEFLSAVLPDEASQISHCLREWADEDHCALIVTTGGTGICPRDVTPEATRAVLDKELPGFAEAMRLGTFTKVRTSILSRAVAGIRGSSLIINLPGKPAAIRECLELIAPAIKEALAHLRGEDPHAARLEGVKS